MNKLNKIIKYIKNPKEIILYLMNKGYFKKLDDEKYLKIKYKLKMNTELNLKTPKTFNEKLQWLKLHDRKPEYTKMVDKYEAKKYVEEIIGQEYIIPTLGVWEKFEDIDFNKLPKQFVLKPTHTSGNIFICEDKSKINKIKLKKEINKWLRRKYYYVHREWPYKNIKPRIIAEKYMADEFKKDLKDYKLFCFNGKVRIILVCSNRFKELKETFFDEEWNFIDVIEGGHGREENIMKPLNFSKMKQLAEKLSKNMSFVRIDFYETNKSLYFGEITFYPASGYERFEPELYNEILGNMLNLPNKE